MFWKGCEDTVPGNQAQGSASCSPYYGAQVSVPVVLLAPALITQKLQGVCKYYTYQTTVPYRPFQERVAIIFRVTRDDSWLANAIANSYVQ